MSKSPTTIELNGKRYDARTGAIVGEPVSTDRQDTTSQPAEPKPEAAAPQPPANIGKNLDGFVRRNAQPEALAPKTPAQHLKREPQRSNTLMRPAVKKPDIPKPDITRVKSPKLSPVVNHARIARAENTTKSPHVTRFGQNVSQIVKKEAHLPVVEPTLAAVSKGVTSELHKLEDALKDANSHLHELEEGAIKKVPFLQRVGFKNKFANVSAMTVAVLLLVGFFGYQNYAQLTVKVASARSGVSASLPSYRPAGFGVDKKIEYQAGKVAINFNSSTDDRAFTLTQQTSNWSSASLLANFVDKTDCNDCYQTWQNDGKTVYVYGDSNATWVDGGIWYVIEGNAKLTSDQILRLASSL